METITIEELEKHNNPQDLWLVIDNKVYDLTKYQDEHPGSDTILQDMGGKDATQDFHDVGHSNDAITKMKSLEIGIFNKPFKEQIINDEKLETNDSLIDEPIMESSLKNRVSWDQLSGNDKKFARECGWNKSSWKRELENRERAPTTLSYIFLDIDGVVHRANESGGYDSNVQLLEKMWMIMDLAQRRNSKIVISSNWRMKFSEMEKIKTKLENMDYTGKIDMLDNNYHSNMDGLLLLPDTKKERSTHILNYLDKYPPGKFVILDDTKSHIKEELMGNFVQTNPSIGIMQIDVEKALNILS